MKYSLFFKSILFLLLIISFYLIYNSKSIFFLNQERFVLSTMEGYLHPHFPLFKILKIQNRNQYYLEIYEKNKNEQFIFLDQILLPSMAFDSHLEIKGLTTNLILSSIKKNGENVLLVPFLDQFLSKRLIAFKFDPEIKKMIPFSFNQNLNSF